MKSMIGSLLTVSLLMLPQMANPTSSMITELPLLQQHKPMPTLPKASKQLLKQIQKNHPKLSKEFTDELASVIELVSKRHGIKAQKVAAIAMQESSYKLDEKVCYEVKGKITCDICMMQINDRTAKAFGFDQDRLRTDLEYCVEAGVLVLKDFKRMYASKEEQWWTRYNTSNSEKREIYLAKVSRYF